MTEAQRSAYIESADRFATEAVKRNPRSFASVRLRAQVLQARADNEGTEDRLRAAAEAWSEAVALYPTEPRTRITAGTIWSSLWWETGEADAARQSAAHFQRALAIDATRLPEVAVKLRPGELQVIENHLGELRAAGFVPEETP